MLSIEQWVWWRHDHYYVSCQSHFFPFDLILIKNILKNANMGTHAAVNWACRHPLFHPKLSLWTECCEHRGFFLSAWLVRCRQQLCATWFTTVITTAVTVPLLNLWTQKVQVLPETWTRSLKVSHLWSVRYVKSGPRVVPPPHHPPPHTYT